MSVKFIPINRDTAYLFPPSLQDWLPEKHLARFVVDIVDQIDSKSQVCALFEVQQIRGRSKCT